jgi:lipoprotein-anchoring transpeptidase ErfK/SrfK
MRLPYTVKIMKYSQRSYPRGRNEPAKQALVYPAARRRLRSGNSTWLLFGGVLLLFSLILLPLFLFTGFYGYYMLTNRVFPGVTVGGMPAGDLTREQLVQKIDNEWNRQQRLVLTDGVNSWAAAPVDLGIAIDAQETASRVYQYGRGPEALREVLWLVRFGQHDIEPLVRFDLQMAQAGLERLSARVNIPAQNASLRFENGEWIALPGQNGKAVQIEQTLRQIGPDPEKILENGYVPVVMRAVAPEVSDLTPALEQLRSSLDNPLLLRAHDPITDETTEWRVPRETFASWVTVETSGAQVSFGLDREQFASYVQGWAGSLGPGKTVDAASPPADLAERWQSGQPVNLVVQHQPTSYTVEPGDTLTRIAFKVGMPYWKIQQANPGLEADSIFAGQVITIPSRNEMLPLPIVPGKRIVINISQQRMWTFENGSQRSEHVISTGIDRSPTIPGIYQVQTHDPLAYASVWDLHMPNFIGIYEAWPGFMNGIHGLPTLSSGNRLWAGNLGRPVSYGCIILNLQEAEDLYQWAEKGVVVEIQP